MRRMRKRRDINHKSITHKIRRGKSCHTRGIGQNDARVRVHKHRANVVIWKERVQARERRAGAQHAKLRRIQTGGLARQKYGDNGFIFLRVSMRTRMVSFSYWSINVTKLFMSVEIEMRCVPPCTP